ncbi:MAG: deoxynucleoside kinase [Flavobacteriales bacterium]|nr:deoxynucleoside kinase [Flavobacteriales bacterium]
MIRYPYIALEGLIGAGKTTLAKRLAADLNGRLVLEEFDDNPFLPRFYADPKRYAFSVELSFLAQRYHQLKRVTEHDLFHACTVADYSLGKSLVFAKATLDGDEHALFMDLYRIMFADLPKPDLLIYLHPPLDLVRDRIRLRGRSFELGITDAYLQRLQEGYMDHLQKLPGQRVLVLDIGAGDLRGSGPDYEAVLDVLSEPLAAGFHVRVLPSTVRS